MWYYSVAMVLLVFLISEPVIGNDSIPLDSAEVSSVISRHHLTKPPYNEVFPNSRTAGSLNNYLQKLDKYSRYKTPEETLFSKMRSKKSRQGIGLSFLVNKRGVLGIPVQDGSAFKRGIVEPLFIKSLNGRPLSLDDFSSYSFLTKVPPGSNVKVVAMRTPEGRAKTFNVPSGNVNEKNFRFNSRSQFDYIRVYKFDSSLLKPTNNFLSHVRKGKPLVIDLRFSPGGDVFAMVDLLSLFIDEGKTVVTLAGAQTRNSIELKTLSGRVLEASKEIIFLVSPYTASSAELFVRAIQHHRRNVKIWGQATKGKCYAQETYPLQNGGSIRLTAYRVLDAGGVDCESQPLLPDTVIKNSVSLTLDGIEKEILK